LPSASAGLFALEPPALRFAHIRRQPANDTNQPTSYRTFAPKRWGFARQQKKRCLANIIGIAGVGEQTPTHAERHSCMALNKLRKGSFFLAVHKASQQLTIGRLGIGARRP
jgi:hypothetical protein